MPDPERKNTHIAGVYGLAAAVVGVVLAFVLTQCDEDEPDLPANVSLQPDFQLTKDINVCAWEYETNPIPLVSLDPVSVRIDGRCNYPFNTDPAADVGVSVFPTPSNDNPRRRVARIQQGTKVELRCWTTGDIVEDATRVTRTSPIFGLRSAKCRQRTCPMRICAAASPSTRRSSLA